MARHRRRRYAWLPLLGSGNPVEERSSTPGRATILNVPTTGAANSIIIPVTFDSPQEALSTLTTQQTPLGDLIGNEYIIERIVGDIFHNLATLNVASSNFAVLVCSFFFVARAADANDVVPVGDVSLATELENYNANFVDNIQESYMFRRCWVLGGDRGARNNTNPMADITIADDGTSDLRTFTSYPPSNVHYGERGTHFDIKSSRRVAKDERLFYGLSAQNFPIGTAGTGTVTLVSYLDLRILAQLVKAQQRSTL